MFLLLAFTAKKRHDVFIFKFNHILQYDNSQLYGNDIWMISAMTSQNKNGGDSGGTLYREPMKRSAFCYD